MVIIWVLVAVGLIAGAVVALRVRSRRQRPVLSERERAIQEGKKAMRQLERSSPRKKRPRSVPFGGYLFADRGHQDGLEAGDFSGGSYDGGSSGGDGGGGSY